MLVTKETTSTQLECSKCFILIIGSQEINITASRNTDEFQVGIT